MAETSTGGFWFCWKTYFLTIALPPSVIDCYCYCCCCCCRSFLSSQAAEKALKAAQYDLDANNTRDHNLVQNCYGLDDQDLTQLATRLEHLVGGSTRMRYPDRMAYPSIPNDVYKAETANEASQIATKIVQRVKIRLT